MAAQQFLEESLQELLGIADVQDFASYLITIGKRRAPRARPSANSCVTACAQCACCAEDKAEFEEFLSQIQEDSAARGKKVLRPSEITALTNELVCRVLRCISTRVFFNRCTAVRRCGATGFGAVSAEISRGCVNGQRRRAEEEPKEQV